ncbi:hypothetical protein BDK51DRAFT_29529, partial [Blyttiomyces helicus]
SYGDSFLPNSTSYDMLYYELCRIANYFQELQRILARETSTYPLSPTTPRGSHRTPVLRPSDFRNIATILDHFLPKFQNDAAPVTLTPDEVLAIIRAEYGAVERVPLEGLEVPSRYEEQPGEVGFLRSVGRTVVAEIRPAVAVGW